MRKSNLRDFDFLSLVKSRKSTYEFGPKNVSDADLRYLLESARWAPSPHNTQSWSFIVVKDPDLINTLIGQAYSGFFHTPPPLVVVVVAEPIYVDQPALLKGKARKLASYHRYLSVAMPVSNLVLAAKDRGIDSFIASLMVKPANKLLGVPSGKDALLVVGLGYETKNAYVHPRSRRQLRTMVFKEHYGERR